MKSLVLSAVALLGTLLSTTNIQAQKPELPAIIEIGTKAPLADLKMPSTNGRDLSLIDIKEKNGLLVIFSCNTCPFVVGNGEKSEGWENRYRDYQMQCAGSQVGMVLINSNEAKRGAGDNLDDMKKRAAEQAYRSFYVLDANHQMADAFGARTTPHVFLFDSGLNLVYKGAIDDSPDSPGAVKEFYLRDAINNMVSQKPISPNSTKQMGCSIKRY